MKIPTCLSRPSTLAAALVAGTAVWAAAGGIQPVFAAKQMFLGQHGDWYAYSLDEDGGKTCYMVSKPKRSSGKVSKRGDVVAFVTHRPKEGERDVVSFQAGYTYKSGSDVTVTVGDDKFSLFTSRDTAWARKPADDKAMVHAMIKGVTMKVVGTSSRGDRTIDTYSLHGFTAAHKKITAACGLK